MIKLFKISCFALMIAAVMTVGAFAASFDDLRLEAASLGVDSAVIGGENDLVKSSDAESFLKQYAVYETELGGEYASTAEYLSAILGIMGYSADKGDFLAEFPYDKAAQVGILDSLAPNSVYLTNKMMLQYAFAAKNTASALADMPEIFENGSIVGLTNFYDPSVSENIVDMFNGELLVLEAADTNKFNVSVVQGAGTYSAEVKQIESVELLSDIQLKKGNYFAAYAFSGAEITVNISLNSDIQTGYEVYSTSSSYTAEFVDGVLSVKVSEPQTLRIVFDGASGKSITVFVGEHGADTLETAGAAVGGNVSENKKTGKAEKLCPVKITINKTIVYYPAILKASMAYISDQLYVGSYSGDDALNVDGDVYIPVSAFAGNGNIETAEYDAKQGLILLTAKNADSSVLGSFVAANSEGTKAVTDGSSVSFENYDSSAAKGIIAPINIESFEGFDCVRFTSTVSMTGKSVGVPFDLYIIGYNDLGETEVISVSSARAYSRIYRSTAYFDISKLDGAYEDYYLLITSSEAQGVVINLDEITFSAFEISSEMGDNEFNPF